MQCYKYSRCKKNDWCKISLEIQINSKKKVISSVSPQKNDCDIKISKQSEAVSYHAPWTKAAYLKMDAEGRLQQKNQSYSIKSGASWKSEKWKWNIWKKKKKIVCLGTRADKKTKDVNLGKITEPFQLWG